MTRRPRPRRRKKHGPVARRWRRVLALLVAVAAGIGAGPRLAPALDAAERLLSLAEPLAVATALPAGVTMGWLWLSGRAGGAWWLAGLTLWTVGAAIPHHVTVARGPTPAGLDAVSNLALFTLLPVAMLAWWASYAPKTTLTWRAIPLWTIWPAGFLALDWPGAWTGALVLSGWVVGGALLFGASRLWPVR